MSHVFISSDAADVDTLFFVHEAFRRLNVSDVFRGPDEDDKDPLFSLTPVMEASAVLILFSKAAMKSKRVRTEVELALELNKPVFCLRLDNTRTTGWWAKALDAIETRDTTQNLEDTVEACTTEIRSIYEKRCPVVSVMNLKGGVGKTTVTAQVFGHMQKERKTRILLIDFDPQFNLSQFFLTRDETDARVEADRSVLAMFEPNQLTSSVHASPALDWTRFNDGIFHPPARTDLVASLIPPSSLSGALDLVCGQFELTKYAFLEDRASLDLAANNLKQTLDGFRKDYDLIVIDTNPSASFLTQVTLDVTDHVLAPVLANEFSLRGLRLLDMILKRFTKDDHRPDVHVLFNGVPKSQQNAFERDARDGLFDAGVGFELSTALLSETLYQSAYLDLKATAPDEDPTSRLATNSARGPFALDLRRRLSAVSLEVFERLRSSQSL